MTLSTSPAGSASTHGSALVPIWVTMQKANEYSMTNPSPEMLERFSRFSQWLKLAISARGLGVNEIANESGISRNTVYTYMRNCLHSDGRYRAPSKEHIKQLATATGADLTTGLKIMGFDSDPIPSAPSEVIQLPQDAQTALARFIQTMTPADIVYLPKVGRVAAGVVRESIGDYGFERVGILKSSIPDKVATDELFVCQVKGYCLAAAFIADGDSLICRRSDTANSGDVVIVIEDDEAIAKRYREDASGAWLETDPLSGRPKRVKVGPESRIFGVAISRTGPIH